MRGSILLVALVTVGLLGGIQLNKLSGTARSSQQPAAGTPVVLISVERIGLTPGTPVVASGANTPQHLWLERVTLLPGADSGQGVRSGARFLFIERGSVELTVQRGAVSFTCSGPCAAHQGTADGSGVAPLDVPITLQAGDTAAQYDSTTFSLRNAGSETAVVLIEGLGPAPWGVGRGCGGGCF